MTGGQPRNAPGAKIKICGLFRPQDVDFVNEAGPDWCGFILDFPRSHRSVTAEQAAALRARLAPGIVPVGVFVDQPPERVAALLRGGVVEAAQLHGREDAAYIAALRALAPGFPLWKAFRVRGADDLAQAARCPADLVLLDSGQGTGQTFDWSLAAGFPRPFLLAGGLTPGNLPQAIRTVRPFGVDLSSGVETGRVKDREKILAAVAAARKEGTLCPREDLASTAGSTSPKR